jgi:X box-binding protein 1
MTAQTIVIKTLPTKTHSTLTVSGQLENDMFEEMYGDPGGPRKRRRLTHLSQEEKLLRRKLKNRVAAQTARDRKKCQMVELEQKVAELERQNRLLASENAALKQESGSLQSENEDLRKRLGTSASIKSESGLGSAVSPDLLPQGQTLAASYWAKSYATSMLTLSLVLLACSIRQANNNSKATRLSLRKPSSLVPCRAALCSAELGTKQWWGPQQQSWNPSMN